MMIIVRGQVYLDESHINTLEDEKTYVKRRYEAVARTLAAKPFHISRAASARMIGKSLRHFYRILKRFREEGIPGLKFKSRRPKNSPNKTPKDIEDKIVAVRKASGFGSKPVSAIVNESFRREGRPKRIYPSLANNILVRTGLIESEKRLQKEWTRFEWGHSNRLIQADLTKLNGVSILTMEDDHSRKGWAMVLKDTRDISVVAGMKKLIQHKYDNLLTDNGSQFNRKNSEMRKYCDEFINEKHIWTSVHHPQTMGKLSAFQKGLKRFLRHKLKGSRNRTLMQKWIVVYCDWYNNGRYHSGIDCVPEERYSGLADPKWYDRLVKVLNLKGVLCSHL